MDLCHLGSGCFYYTAKHLAKGGKRERTVVLRARKLVGLGYLESPPIVAP
jgi:hypothetical protein